MTDVITYIIIHSCLMFVNIFQRKNICKDLRLYSNQKEKYSILGVYTYS